MSSTGTRGAKGSIYAYKTEAGTRYKFVFRDPRGHQSSRGGFRSRAEARRERERMMGRVHRGEVRISRESLEAYWLATCSSESPTSRTAPGRTTAATANCASSPTSASAS